MLKVAFLVDVGNGHANEALFSLASRLPAGRAILVPIVDPVGDTSTQRLYRSLNELFMSAVRDFGPSLLVVITHRIEIHRFVVESLGDLGPCLKGLPENARHFIARHFLSSTEE